MQMPPDLSNRYRKTFLSWKQSEQDASHTCFYPVGLHQYISTSSTKSYTQCLCCLCIAIYCSNKGLLLPLPLSSELKGWNLNFDCGTANWSCYNTRLELYFTVSRHHPLRVWYCEVAIYKARSFTSWFASYLRLWCCNNQVAVYKGWTITSHHKCGSSSCDIT